MSSNNVEGCTMYIVPCDQCVASQSTPCLQGSCQLLLTTASVVQMSIVHCTRVVSCIYSMVQLHVGRGKLVDRLHCRIVQFGIVDVLPVTLPLGR